MAFAVQTICLPIDICVAVCMLPMQTAHNLQNKPKQAKHIDEYEHFRLFGHCKRWMVHDNASIIVRQECQAGQVNDSSGASIIFQWSNDTEKHKNTVLSSLRLAISFVIVLCFSFIAYATNACVTFSPPAVQFYVLLSSLYWHLFTDFCGFLIFSSQIFGCALCALYLVCVASICRAFGRTEPARYGRR